MPAKKILIMLCLSATAVTAHAQTVQLQYTGNKQKIIEALAVANRILASPEFRNRIDSIQSFDNTVFNGRQIMAEMQAITTVQVTEYFKRWTKTTAKTQTQIRMNTAKLNRSVAAIVNTLVHEAVHAVDWLVNKHWDYTHRTQFEEIPPISAPYIIGSIAEGMVIR